MSLENRETLLFVVLVGPIVLVLIYRSMKPRLQDRKLKRGEMISLRFKAN